MSDNHGGDLAGPDQDEATASAPTVAAYAPTGNVTVDSVLESLEKLDHAPVPEHVAVYESAHENLRAAMADAGDNRTS